jgi:hypothetical protein
MRTPLRPLPARVARWRTYARWLRWSDAVVAWLIVLTVATAWWPGPHLADRALLAAVVIVLAALIPVVRIRWRPVSGAVGLALSGALRPGHRAWYVRASSAEPVLITGRRGLRLVIARPDQGTAEGISVRRTRVLLVPLDRD